MDPARRRGERPTPVQGAAAVRGSRSIARRGRSNRRSFPEPGRTAQPRRRPRRIPSQPIENPRLPELLEASGDGSDADGGGVGDRLVAGIEPSGAEAKEIEDERVQHGEAIAAEDAAVLAGPAGLAVEGARPMVEPHRLPLGQRLELHLAGDAAGPDWGRRIGLEVKERCVGHRFSFREPAEVGTVQQSSAVKGKALLASERIFGDDQCASSFVSVKKEEKTLVTRLGLRAALARRWLF